MVSISTIVPSKFELISSLCSIITIILRLKLNLSPCIPLSLKGEGEGLKEGASPLQITLGCV
jgi:hypothetical protein